jgi:hypothetical protein
MKFEAGAKAVLYIWPPYIKHDGDGGTFRLERVLGDESALYHRDAGAYSFVVDRVEWALKVRAGGYLAGAPMVPATLSEHLGDNGSWARQCRVPLTMAIYAEELE